MTKENDGREDFKQPSVNGAALRKRAEEKVRATGAQGLDSLSPEEGARLLHELRVHQIELEMQNEELRRAQEELEASRARYFDLYELAPVGYFTLSEPGLILEANLTAATLLGLPKGALSKTPLTRYILPDDQDIYYRHRKRLFETGEPQVFEIRVMLSDGAQSWVRVEAHVAQDGENGVSVCRAVMIDITGRKKAEEALRASEENARLRAEELEKLMDLVPAGIWVSRDPQCRSVVGNREASRLYESKGGQDVSAGTADGEVLNTERRFFSGGRELKPEELPMQQAVSKGVDVLNYELGVLLPSGRRITMLGNASPLFDDQGGVRGCLGVYMDITERKLIENTQLFLARYGWAASGEDFFESLARYLGESLGMDYVCIDRLEGEMLSARTLAVYFDGKFEDNVTYTLKDTPCGEVVKNDICCFPKDVRHLFPKDSVLQEMKAESYVGTILWDSKGQPIGLIAVIGRQPLANQHTAESVLKLAGVRASGELERKRAEEALREGEERFHRLFEDDLTGDYLCTPEGQILLCNPAFATIFGYSSRDEAVGTSMLELYVDPGERDEMLEALKQQGKLGRYESWRKRRDGEPIHVVENLVGHFNDRGELYEVKGYIFDDTERNRAEEELKESEASLARAQLVSHLANWDLDVGTDKVRGSDELYRMFNLEADLTLGAYVEKFHPDDRAYVLESINDALYEGKPYNIDYRIIPRIDDIRHVHAEGEVTCDEKGLPIKFFGIVQDITERKRAEEALMQSEQRYKALNAELELRVRERTAELEQRNEELQQFTFAAAHDMQEPLRKIQTFSDLIAFRCSDSLNEQSRDYLRRMNDTASRMRNVLQSLLNYSGVTSRPEHFARVDLNEIAREVVSDLRIKILDADASVEIGDLPAIEADAAQMKQLLQELLDNALKFVRKGEKPRVRIRSSRNSTGQEGECEICVEDNGIGFEERYLDRIFKPFQRLHGRKEYGGVGMGLAICAKVVELHKGRITARSAPAKGSTFFISLPVKRGEQGVR